MVILWNFEIPFQTPAMGGAASPQTLGLTVSVMPCARCTVTVVPITTQRAKVFL